MGFPWEYCSGWPLPPLSGPPSVKNCSQWPFYAWVAPAKWPVASLSHASPFSTKGSDPCREYNLFVNRHCSVFHQQPESADTKYLDLGHQCACNMHSECTQLRVSPGRSRPSALFCLASHCTYVQVHPAFHLLMNPPRSLKNGLGWPSSFHLLTHFPGAHLVSGMTYGTPMMLLWPIGWHPVNDYYWEISDEQAPSMQSFR